MDASDATRINKIMKHLENNQQDLEKQLLNQYSINKQVLQHFNYSVSNIQYNEQLLRNKIIKINTNINNNTGEIELLKIKDLFNQLSMMFNTVLDLLTEIENSITFCAIGAMHPSIIKTADLLLELNRLEPFYKDTAFAC